MLVSQHHGSTFMKSYPEGWWESIWPCIWVHNQVFHPQIPPCENVVVLKRTRTICKYKERYDLYSYKYADESFTSLVQSTLPCELTNMLNHKHAVQFPFWNLPKYDIPEVTSKNKLLQHLLQSCQHPGHSPPVLRLLIRQVQILGHATLFIQPPFHLPGISFSEMITPESTQYLFRKCPLPVKLYS